MFFFPKVFFILSLFYVPQLWASDFCKQFVESNFISVPLAFGPENLAPRDREPKLILEPSGVLTFNPNRYEEIKDLVAPFLLSHERVVIETFSVDEARRLKDYLQSQKDFSGFKMFAIPAHVKAETLRVRVERLLQNHDQVYFFAVRGQLDWTEFVEIQEHIRFYGEGETPPMLPKIQVVSVLQSLFFKSVEEYLDWASSLERPLNLPVDPQAMEDLVEGALTGARINFDGQQPNSPMALPPPPPLDRKSRASQMMSLENAIQLMRLLQIRDESTFRLWRGSGARPKNFPSNPDKYYAGKGWKSWSHFFGSHMLTLEEHEKLVQERGVITLKGYLELVEKRDYEGRLSRTPHIYFKSKGWVSWNKFFNLPEDPFMNFTEAMLLMKRLGIQSVAQFKQWSSSGQRPKNFPSNPDKYYKNKGWKSWSHFFSNHRLSLEEHIELARARKIKTIEEYHELVEKNDFVGRLVKNPDVYFRGAGGWISWDHFFGPQRHYLSLDRLRLAVKRHDINSEQGYHQARLSDPELAKTFPPEPDKFYEAWAGWQVLFNNKVLIGACKAGGNKNCTPSEFFSVAEARLLLRLYGIETDEELTQWLTSPQRPERFPDHPERYYADEWIPLGN